MANIPFSELARAFQTLNEIEQDIKKISKYAAEMRTKLKEAIEYKQKDILNLLSMERHNLHQTIKNLMQKDQRLSAHLTNFELMK